MKERKEQSSREVFCKEFLKILKNSSGKHLCKSLFFNEELRACNFVKKRLRDRCILVNFATFWRTSFFTTGRLFLETEKQSFIWTVWSRLWSRFSWYCLWTEYGIGNCRLYLEMLLQVVYISGNIWASEVYIRIYFGNRNTWSVKSF